MKEISILLPSLRPELLVRTVNEFEMTNSNCDYEIIVVSPFEFTANKVRHITEETPSGSVSATNIAYNWAEGRYVVYFSDDVSPTPNCLNNMLEFLKDKPSPFIGAFKMVNSNNREIGPFGAYGKLYACYGCMSKGTVEKIGGYFDNNFLYSWADIDISLRTWQAGGRVEICDSAIVKPRQVEDEVYKNHRTKYWDKDVNTFLDKWHNILGEKVDRKDGSVNKKL